MEVSNETKGKGNGGVGLAWAGAIIGIVGNRIPWDYWIVTSVIGLAMAIVGCVLWAQRKNRHWAFGFWGLLAPIGFLGVSLLKDKSAGK